mmetsp:Transcript_15683/g.52790  ORF Transcript_15683/g.52790 Transcript_15683/m.52790 type:complete len:456 (-) Transcript_15683:163-1530(-)
MSRAAKRAMRCTWREYSTKTDWTNRFGSQQWLTKRATLPVREASTQSSGLSCVLASTPLGPSCDVFLRLATCPFSSPSRLKRYESSTLKRYLQVNLFKRLKKRYESSTSQARGQSQAAGPRPGLEARAPLETGRLVVNQQCAVDQQLTRAHLEPGRLRVFVAQHHARVLAHEGARADWVARPHAPAAADRLEDLQREGDAAPHHAVEAALVAPARRVTLEDAVARVEEETLVVVRGPAALLLLAPHRTAARRVCGRKPRASLVGDAAAAPIGERDAGPLLDGALVPPRDLREVLELGDGRAAREVDVERLLVHLVDDWDRPGLLPLCDVLVDDPARDGAARLVQQAGRAPPRRVAARALHLRGTETGALLRRVKRQVALRAPHVPPRELDLPAAPAASVCKQAEGVAPRRQVGGQRGGGGRFFAGSRRRRWWWLVARRAVEAAPRLAARAQKRVG